MPGRGRTGWRIPGFRALLVFWLAIVLGLGGMAAVLEYLGPPSASGQDGAMAEGAPPPAIVDAGGPPAIASDTGPEEERAAPVLELQFAAGTAEAPLAVTGAAESVEDAGSSPVDIGTFRSMEPIGDPGPPEASDGQLAGLAPPDAPVLGPADATPPAEPDPARSAEDEGALMAVLAPGRRSDMPFEPGVTTDLPILPEPPHPAPATEEASAAAPLAIAAAIREVHDDGQVPVMALASGSPPAEQPVPEAVSDDTAIGAPMPGMTGDAGLAQAIPAPAGDALDAEARAPGIGDQAQGDTQDGSPAGPDPIPLASREGEAGDEPAEVPTPVQPEPPAVMETAVTEDPPALAPAAETAEPPAPRPVEAAPALVPQAVAASGQPAPQPPAPEPTGPSVAVAATPLPPAMIAAIMRRGEQMLSLGDISGARRLFERAASAGDAAAATALGRTFDARFLAAIGAQGLPADRAMAARWYERAAALGDREAAQLLSALPPR